MKPKFYEFFAGGGMARAGLEPHWKCLFANDFEPLKAQTYIQNWGSKEFKEGDIGELRATKLPARADLAWASFPCQDLSIAGAGLGLEGDRSVAFWAYCDLLRRLHARSRAPNVLVLENVPGALTSRGGKDFAAICASLAKLNYRFGAILIDAAHFVPQSRPRLFVIATRTPKRRLSNLVSGEPIDWCSSEVLQRAYEQLPKKLKARWLWWRLPKPRKRRLKLSDIVKRNDFREPWHTNFETERLLALMTPAHRRKIRRSKKNGRLAVGTIYRRMRSVRNGSAKQRAEVRFDDIAGCLRTAAGGSSRQIIVSVGQNKVRTRLLAIKEGAKLMGLPSNYGLPKNYYEAFRVLGDGLAVPLVRFLSSQLLLPLVKV
jgi:DNA (cytosine-5)-methyltransferase 1